MDAKLLALYLGCPIKRWNKGGEFFGATLDGVSKEGAHSCFDTVYEVLKPDEFKLILRPLSSITKEEMKELVWGEQELRHASLQKNPALFVSEFQYLLSKHFDLFGLIEKGEAIEQNL